MEPKKEYRSAQRSRRMIRQAFLELLDEKKFSKITVSDIVRRADLNRSTFYCHYPDIYGLVDALQDEILCRNLQLFARLEYHDLLNDPTPYLNSITATLQEHRALFKKLGFSLEIHQILGKYQQLMYEDLMEHSNIPQEVRSSPLFAVRVHFFLGGIMNTYQQWFDGRLDCAPEQISQQIAWLIRQSASSFLERDWTQVL